MRMWVGCWSWGDWSEMWLSDWRGWLDGGVLSTGLSSMRGSEMIAYKMVDGKDCRRCFQRAAGRWLRGVQAGAVGWALLLSERRAGCGALCQRGIVLSFEVEMENESRRVSRTTQRRNLCVCASQSL